MSDPKKSLGQHWLNDERTLNSIVDSAQLSNADTVLEVGPGLGSLTFPLLESAGHVVAVELDNELADNLRLIDQPNLTVVEEDIRNYNLNGLPGNYKVVANIPYYLTNFLLRLLFESENPPMRIVVLVQKQVAERLAAKPGDMSLLSISAQLFGRVQLGSQVPADLFTPPPKVDSQVVVIQRLTNQDPNRDTILRLAKVGFSAKRKKLANNLSSGLQIDKKVAEAQLSNLGLDPGIRSQELSIDNWSKLSQALAAYF